MSMTNTTPPEAPTNEAIITALTIILGEADEPKSTSDLSVAVTTLLRREGFKVHDVHGIPGTTVSNLLSTTRAALLGVTMTGVKATVGRRREKHWALHHKVNEWSRAEVERTVAIEAIKASVYLREVWDRFEVILDDKLPAAASFVYRRISHFEGGREVEDEIIPKELAARLAVDTRQAIVAKRIKTAGL